MPSPTERPTVRRCCRGLLVCTVLFWVGPSRMAAVNGWRVVDGHSIPWNVFSPKVHKVPFAATVVPNHQDIFGDGNMDYELETNQFRISSMEDGVVIDYPAMGGRFWGSKSLPQGLTVPFLEGQWIGVMEPQPGGPSKVRLYPIASSRLGDDQRGKTLSLCCTTNAGWPLRQLKLGEKINITGPIGTALLPTDLREATLILVATSEGIASFRGYLRWLFHDRKEIFEGLVWLLLGAQVIYDEEFRVYQSKFPENFRFLRRSSNLDEMLELRRSLEENCEELWKCLQLPKTYLYIIGSKDLDNIVSDVLAVVKGPESWLDLRRSMQEQRRYHCEVS